MKQTITRALVITGAVSLLRLTGFTALAQTQKADSVKSKEAATPDKKPLVYTAVERLPEYPGGQDAMMQFISRNIKYPRKSAREGIEGRVYINFIVNLQGKVEDVQVTKGLAEDIDAEAIRVIQLLEGFSPAQQNGKPVLYRYVVPIKFTLTGQGTQKSQTVPGPLPAHNGQPRRSQRLFR